MSEAALESHKMHLGKQLLEYGCRKACTQRDVQLSKLLFEQTSTKGAQRVVSIWQTSHTNIPFAVLCMGEQVV